MEAAQKYSKEALEAQLRKVNKTVDGEKIVIEKEDLERIGDMNDKDYRFSSRLVYQTTADSVVVSRFSNLFLLSSGFHVAAAYTCLYYDHPYVTAFFCLLAVKSFANMLHSRAIKDWLVYSIKLSQDRQSVTIKTMKNTYETPLSDLKVLNPELKDVLRACHSTLERAKIIKSKELSPEQKEAFEKHCKENKATIGLEVPESSSSTKPKTLSLFIDPLIAEIDNFNLLSDILLKDTEELAKYHYVQGENEVEDEEEEERRE